MPPIDTEAAANALFGRTSKPTPSAATAPATGPTVLTQAQTAPSASVRTAQPATVQGRELAAAERLATLDEPVSIEAEDFFDGGRPVEEGEAHTLLDSIVAPLMAQALEEGRHDDAAAGAEAHKAGANLLAEDGVGAPIARDLVRDVGEWLVRPALSDDDCNALTNRTMAALRKSWGADTDNRVRQCQTYINKAVKRAPQLAVALDAGLGSQEKFIRQVYAASRAAARNAAKRGRR